MTACLLIGVVMRSDALKSTPVIPVDGIRQHCLVELFEMRRCYSLRSSYGEGLTFRKLEERGILSGWDSQKIKLMPNCCSIFCRATFGVRVARAVSTQLRDTANWLSV